MESKRKKIYREDYHPFVMRGRCLIPQGKKEAREGKLKRRRDRR